MKTEPHDRPLSPPGAEIMAQAYEAFDAWCKKRDPEGEMEPSQLVAEYPLAMEIERLKSVLVEIIERLDDGQTEEPRDVASLALQGIGHGDAECFMWRDKFKGMEQRWMCLKDDYSQLARAAGAPHDAWFGDPFEKHAETLKRVEDMRAEVDRLREELADVKSFWRDQAEYADK
jgi:hypothetical protein